MVMKKPVAISLLLVTLVAVAAATPPDPQHEEYCHVRFNCTGRKGKVTCGSNGKWYQNVCVLRYERCVYNLTVLQRDREEISCEGVPKPVFTDAPSPPTSPPTTTVPATVTPDSQRVAVCFKRFDCTGHQGKVTCGSDGKWYQNVCVLRYERCVYNLTVQRDREEISCEGVPKPVFTDAPPSKTTVPATVTPDSQRVAVCLERFDCTGHQGKVTCGSDGKWYKNVCVLRYERCVYNLILQRDTEEISCADVPKPDFN